MSSTKISSSQIRQDPGTETYRSPGPRKVCTGCKKSLNDPEDFPLPPGPLCLLCESARLAEVAKETSDKARKWAIGSLAFAALNVIMQFVNLWLKYHR